MKLKKHKPITATIRIQPQTNTEAAALKEALDCLKKVRVSASGCDVFFTMPADNVVMFGLCLSNTLKRLKIQ